MVNLYPRKINPEEFRHRAQTMKQSNWKQVFRAAILFSVGDDGAHIPIGKQDLFSHRKDYLDFFSKIRALFRRAAV